MKHLKQIETASDAVQNEYLTIYNVKGDNKTIIKGGVTMYTITFKDWDDSIISSQKYVEGTAITIPSNPIREGYEFTGWTPTINPTAVADATYVAQYKEQPTFEYVDLGLPSGKLWAKCNVGATKETGYGKYFQWGDTKGYTDASYSTWETTPFNNGSSSYNSSYFTANKSEWLDGDVLKPEYDAVYQATNGKAHMPTREDFNELKANTNSSWEENFKGSGVNGYLFRSTKDMDKYIFIPAAGCASNGSLYGQGSYGGVWSSSLNSSNPDGAWYLYFGSGSVYVDNDGRCGGYSVRGVLE